MKEHPRKEEEQLPPLSNNTWFPADPPTSASAALMAFLYGPTKNLGMFFTKLQQIHPVEGLQSTPDDLGTWSSRGVTSAANSLNPASRTERKHQPTPPGPLTLTSNVFLIGVSCCHVELSRVVHPLHHCRCQCEWNDPGVATRIQN